MSNKKLLGLILTTLYMIILAPIVSYAAAPVVTITKGNPSSPVSPPYAIEFAVSDDTGITSIKVNGRELGPGGGLYYTAEWNTYGNGTFTIVATDNEGLTGSASVVIDKITTGATATTQAQPQPETTREVETTTAAETTAQQQVTQAETTKAEIQTPAATQATIKQQETTKKAVETTERAIEATEELPETSPVETSAFEETVAVETIEETTEAVVKKEPPSIYDLIPLMDNVMQLTNGMQVIVPEAVNAVDIGLTTAELIKDNYEAAKTALEVAKETTATQTIEETTEEEPSESTDTIKETTNDLDESENNEEEAAVIPDYQIVTVLTPAERMIKPAQLVIIAFLVAILIYNVLVIKLNKKRLRLYKLYIKANTKRKVATNEKDRNIQGLQNNDRRKEIADS